MPPGPDPTALERLADILAQADRSVVVTSRTAADPSSAPVLVRIAELLGAPVIDQGDRANLPCGHPLHAVADVEPLKSADAVLLLDSEVPWVPAQAAPPEDARVVQIDVDPVKPTMPLWSYPIEVALTADTRVALPLLEQALLCRATTELSEKWTARRRVAEAEIARRREVAHRKATSELPADAPDVMLAALGRALPEEAILVEEPVTNRPAVGRQVTRQPGCFFDSGAPALGWALGGAFGVKLARPEAPVVAVCGDGSFNFSVPTAALWSAHRYRAPFVAVVLNNHSYWASKLPVIERCIPTDIQCGPMTFPRHSSPRTRITRRWQRLAEAPVRPCTACKRWAMRSGGRSHRPQQAVARCWTFACPNRDRCMGLSDR